jgi:hypothetical protein
MATIGSPVGRGKVLLTAISQSLTKKATNVRTNVSPARLEFHYDETVNRIGWQSLAKHEAYVIVVFAILRGNRAINCHLCQCRRHKRITVGTCSGVSAYNNI